MEKLLNFLTSNLLFANILLLGISILLTVNMIGQIKKSYDLQTKIKKQREDILAEYGRTMARARANASHIGGKRTRQLLGPQAYYRKSNSMVSGSIEVDMKKAPLSKVENYRSLDNEAISNATVN